jgi:hypothetical protein
MADAADLMVARKERERKRKGLLTRHTLQSLSPRELFPSTRATS